MPSAKETTSKSLEELIGEKERELQSTVAARKIVQAERDQVEQLWEACIKANTELRQQISVTEHQLACRSKDHATTINAYERNLQMLTFNHELETNKLLGDAEKKKSWIHARNEQFKSDLGVANARIDDDFKSATLVNTVDVNMAMQNALQLNRFREELTSYYKEATAECEMQLARLKNELSVRERVEIHDIEEKKNLQINELLRNHQEIFFELRKYFNDVVRDYVSSIQQYQTEIHEMETTEAIYRQEISELQTENQHMSTLLQTELEDGAELNKVVMEHEKNVFFLKNMQALVESVNNDIKETKQQVRQDEERLRKIDRETNEIKAEIQAVIGDGSKIINLERQLYEEKERV